MSVTYINAKTNPKYIKFYTYEASDLMDATFSSYFGIPNSFPLDQSYKRQVTNLSSAPLGVQVN